MASPRETELRELGSWLDEYGATAESRRRTWDDVLADYDKALVAVATEHGLTLPDPPARIQRRFTSDDRDALERQLGQLGVHARDR